MASAMSNSNTDFNSAIIEEFHANCGHVGGPFEDSPLLLLHHTGARSGKARINPLGYLADRDRYVIVASNGGSPTNPAWYYNLVAHPEVIIEVGIDTIRAVASEATGKERERLFQAMAVRAAQIVEYQTKTDRVIPVMVLIPVGND